MAYSDLKGLAVSTSSSEALTAYERGLDLFFRWRGGAMDALNAAVKADEHFVLAHCARALIAWRMGQVAVASSAHEQVMALADHAHDEREHLHVQTVDALQRGDREKAQTLLEHASERYPLDRLMVRSVGLNCIARGDYEGGIGISRRSLDADPGEPQFMTMLGFFLEQSGYNDEGLAMSARSLALDPTNLYTYHAVAHAYQARGDYPKALETFERAASLERYAHILWHLAEARSILGYERLTRDYWGSTTPALPVHERVELLWRLEMLQHIPTDNAVWTELAAESEKLLEHADALTLWMHHWIGLAFARAGQTAKAERQVAYLRQLPEGRASGYWSTQGADILEGEFAIIRGDEARAVQLMAAPIRHIHRMGGGSREQKDIFKDIYMELHRRLGDTDAVITLAQERLLQNPNHLQSLAALAWAYGRTDQAALERQACAQLVRKAEAVGVHPDAPTLSRSPPNPPRGMLKAMPYCPSRDHWDARSPAELGLAPDAIAAAIDYHESHETTWRRDFLTASGRYIGVADEPPAPDDVLGPVEPRQGPNGLVLRHGVIAAEWGDTARVDMTFSIAKSYLSVLAGVAVDRGLIRDLDEPVHAYGLDDGFDSEQNRSVTWRHLLQQTSEWQGTLWGKPDSIDHNRNLGQSDLGFTDKGTPRPMRVPGSYWEYNDVRVNRLSLSLLRLFRRPLADVVREAIMDPIGASDTWRWQPYRNSWVEIDGMRMPSVPGGSHWGGGLWIGSRDHARVGLLMLRRGEWQGQKLLSERWIDEMRRPCAVNPGYGLLWWLNTGRAPMAFAPESSYSARGAGSNVIWIDPEHDLVVVVRWIDRGHVEPFLRLIVESVKG